MNVKYLFVAALIFACGSDLAARDKHPSDRLMAQLLVGGWGCADLKWQNERLVRDMAREMGLKNLDMLYVKRLSQHVSRGFWVSMLPEGRNQIAMAVHVFGFVRSIFIDERAFDQLSIDEKRFIIARELMKIKNDHTIKLPMVRSAVSGATAGAGVLLAPWIGRRFDMSADVDACKHIGTFDAALSYYRVASKYKRECKEDLRPWKILKLKRSIDKLLYSFFSGRHPFRKKRRLLEEEKMSYSGNRY